MGNPALQRQFYKEQVRIPLQLKLCLGNNRLEVSLHRNEAEYSSGAVWNISLRLRPCCRTHGFGLFFRFLKLSAALCAGSQVAACSCDVTCFTMHSDFGSGWRQFWWPKNIIWCACGMHFGPLGDHRAIRGHYGAQEGGCWDPGLDLCGFRMDFGTTF